MICLTILAHWGCQWAHKSRVTAHPEVTLGSLGEFEMCPDWVPAMDAGQWSSRIALKTMGLQEFDHIANWAARVRNVSRLGSQID